uniref:Uncharacterized protein n=1 Tax=Monopterus albus TaxID=43700 RepID=A0A3Q3K214_MONAL
MGNSSVSLCLLFPRLYLTPPSSVSPTQTRTCVPPCPLLPPAYPALWVVVSLHDLIHWPNLLSAKFISSYVLVFCLVQIVWGLDEVKLLNPPEEPLTEHHLEILFSCDGPAIVQLDCIIFFDTGFTTTLPLRQWRCVPGEPKIKAVKLNLPDWLVYQADGIVPDSQWVLSCILRALVRYNGFDDTERSIAAQDVATLHPKPFFSRPVKQHQLCIDWSTQIITILMGVKLILIFQTPSENDVCHSETVHLLSSIYASTGETFGIKKTLEHYSSDVLEYLRTKAIFFPWCSFSIWIFLTRHCQKKLCGIIQHIGSYNNYVTPTVLLTESGQLHIQINGESEESSAFLSPFKVPLSEWSRGLFGLQSMCEFKYNVMLDDTEGYFVIGGGKYINGVEGYFGPVVYYRNQISPQSMVMSHSWLLSIVTVSFIRLGRVHSPGVVRAILPLLHQAGCLADNRALYMLSVLYSTGLGSVMPLCLVQAWLLALLAAQKDDRLALLHLGTLHHQGLHGAPTDPDLAYGYYANIAQQTIVDRQKPTPQQTYVEAVFLNNDEILNLQTNEDHHIFQWLKLQARRGAAEAEQTLARMLFWGQQGVPTNIQRAVRHYERGAVQWEDPVSMYDYGIVLLQGHGVKKDIPKALTFLKKAKEKGFVPAINALAWYYEKFEQDYKQAVQLWEQADLLKCPEAAFNLGVMYSQGLYPGKAADQYMAYRYYLKSGERGHIKGAMLTAHIWTTGIPGHINRRPLDAVLWAKWAAEHNGYLGTVLRKALDSYLKSDIALFYYMMAAESGYAAAQFNVAYLCEQNRNFLDPAFATHCMWRYYNMTIQSQNPDTYALIRLGDLLYEGRGDGQKDLISAAEMYKLAALRNDPQGWYNLGLLAEEGYRLPLSILTELGLSELKSLVFSSKRCRDSGDTDSYVPCSLALFSVYLQLFQKDYGAAIKVGVTC